LVELIKRHIYPHSKLFSPTDIKTVMLEEENAQVLLEHVKVLRLLFIRYRERGKLEVVNRKSYLDMCKASDVYRLGLKHDDVVRIFKLSCSDLGGASSLGGKEKLSFSQFVTAIARLAEELVLDFNVVATMSERLHYLCSHLEKIVESKKHWGKIQNFTTRLAATNSLLKTVKDRGNKHEGEGKVKSNHQHHRHHHHHHHHPHKVNKHHGNGKRQEKK